MIETDTNVSYVYACMLWLQAHDQASSNSSQFSPLAKELLLTDSYWRLGGRGLSFFIDAVPERGSSSGSYIHSHKNSTKQTLLGLKRTKQQKSWGWNWEAKMVWVKGKTWRGGNVAFIKACYMHVWNSQTRKKIKEKDIHCSVEILDSLLRTENLGQKS